jgi:hypothetical protein
VCPESFPYSPTIFEPAQTRVLADFLAPFWELVDAALQSYDSRLAGVLNKCVIIFFGGFSPLRFVGLHFLMHVRTRTNFPFVV